MYPLNIPAPSKVGSHTFDKYLRETKIFRNEKFQALAINRTKADVQDFKRLRIKSDARNPPLDEIGNLFFFVFVIAVFFNMPVLVGWFIVFNATLKKIYIFSLYLDGQFYCWRELE
jgi:hypothetical protein